MVLYFAGRWGAWAGNRCGWASGSVQRCRESHSSEGKSDLLDCVRFRYLPLREVGFIATQLEKQQISLKVQKSLSTFVFQMLLVDCYKPNDVSAILIINSISNYLHYRQSCYSLSHRVSGEKCAFSRHNSPSGHLQDFVAALLEKVRGMQKLSTPQKKGELTPWGHVSSSPHHKNNLSLQTQRRDAGMQTQPLNHSVCQTEINDTSPAKPTSAAGWPTVFTSS